MLREEHRQTNHLRIMSIGTYLPANIRTNDWWPEEVVERWKRERNAIGSIADPFAGAKERRVMGPDESVATMELAAATKAIEKAKIDVKEIDFLFEYSFAQDYLGINNSCILHDNLSLRKNCYSLSMDATCNTFLMQINLAKTIIESGQAKYGLLVQSSAASRITSRQSHLSIHFGDGAAATVVGSGNTKQILAQSHRTDGKYHDAIYFGAAGPEWWKDGSIHMMVGNFDVAQKMIADTDEMTKEVIDDALAQCGKRSTDVNFFACHQPTSFFQEQMRRYCGLDNAKVLDHYPTTGTMSAVNLPYLLNTAQETGSLKKEDLVVMFQTGAGLTYSAAVMIW